MTSIFTALAVLTFTATRAFAAKPECESLLVRINSEFQTLNAAYETSLWRSYNAHAGVTADDRRRDEQAVLDFLNDPANLARTQGELKRTDLSAFDRLWLEGYRRLFAANAVTDPKVIVERDALLAAEAELSAAETNLRKGYVDPGTNAFVEASPKKLVDIVINEPDEALRRAASEGLRSFERELMTFNMVEVFKQRNRYARSMGYPDYYEYKTQAFEGLSKAAIFKIMDDLEARTRDAAVASLDALHARVGPAQMTPWNIGYAMRGDLTLRVSKYFPASEALLRWGRTFYNLGIDFRGATTYIDLLDRPLKHNNGFMRVREHSYVTPNGYHPAVTNFTANAMLDRPTAGMGFAQTLHHEGGHNAHFANSGMPGAAYLHEFAPSSIALAETQSMFLDSFLRDPAWLSRYARSAEGEPMPVELMEEMAVEGHRYQAQGIRDRMITPFLERALYELPDEEMTPERFVRIAREIEQKLIFREAARPALTIPHIRSNEASGYYHAYVMADLAVAQTRAHFLRQGGHIVDNPEVGPTLEAVYWAPGNSIDFMRMVKNLTGQKFSADAMVATLNRTQDQVRADVERAIAGVAHARERKGPIDLKLNVIMEHGTHVVTATGPDKSFEQMAREYGDWVKAQTPE